MSGRPQLNRSSTSGSVPTVQSSRRPRDDDDDTGGRRVRRDSRMPRNTSGTSSPENLPLACPYSKHDPIKYSHSHKNEGENTEYRNCSTGYWTSISRLKQHLYRIHDRSRYCCRRCWQNFDKEERYQEHARRANCNVSPEPVEKMDSDKRRQVESRVQGGPEESWQSIYRILFPEDPKPASPYAEWVTGQDLRACLAYLSQRLPALVLQATVQRANSEEARQRALQGARAPGSFPTNFELIQSAIQQFQGEFAEREGLTHVVGPRRPSPTGSGTTRHPTAPTARHSQSQAIQRHQSEDEDDDEEEEEEEDDVSEEENVRASQPPRVAVRGPPIQVAHRGRGGQGVPTSGAVYSSYGAPQFSQSHSHHQNDPSQYHRR